MNNKDYLYAKYYIYGLTEPQSDVIKYVGLSSSPEYRYKKHIKDAKSKNSTKKEKWIRSILSRGEEPGMIIIDQCEGWDQAREMESYYAKKYASNGLKNSIAHLFGAKNLKSKIRNEKPDRYCVFIRKNGKRCRSPALGHKDYCWRHNNT